jgi:hypothetical protein
MKRTDSSLPSGAQETDFFCLPFFAIPTWDISGGVELTGTGGGVNTTGDSLRAFMDLSTSWKGSIDDGCAVFVVEPGSRLMLAEAVAGAGGAFLKLGSLGFGFGAEKNDESDLASLTAAGFVSFFTTTGFDEDAVPTAGFFVGGGGLDGASLSFRFFGLKSTKDTPKLERSGSRSF